MSELVRGSSVPLFDRLATQEGAGKDASWLLLPEQLQASIARELSRLFNTRSRLPPSEFHQNSGTVIDYGVPDFSALYARRGDDVAVLESALTHAVTLFEPRLSNVSVKVQGMAHRADAAAVTVGGDVMIGLKAQRVSFELEMNPSDTV
ncbi:MAG: type VI secretion system baseplate subunit TssE [Ramlibacter sp.]